MKRMNSLLRAWPALLLALAGGLTHAGAPVAAPQATAAPITHGEAAASTAAPEPIRIAWDRVGNEA
jgi:hypothetical protein